jgi:hypothetical protein
MLGITAFPLFSQAPDGEQVNLPGAAGDPPPASGAIFVINAFSFDIKGRTRSDALLRVGEFKEGEEIRGQANLERYIQDKTQILLNQRVLAKAQIDYTIGKLREDGKYPVDLFLAVEDTWNIIAVPYPKFDTNSGFELIIKARDYNFLGTMNPLRIDAGYKLDEKRRSSLVFELDSDTPFKAFGYNWNINFDHFFNYRPEASAAYYYKNVTGLSMELPLKTTTLTFGFEESFIMDQENSERYKPAYGEFQEGLYMSSEMYTSWKIPTGLRIPHYGELTYTPRFSAIFNHELPNTVLAPFRLGPFLKLEHSLGFSRINWAGNYRDGLDISMNNSFNYDFHRLNKDVSALDIDFSAIGTGHFVVSEDFGISASLRYRHWCYHDPGYYSQAADVLRGILDKAVRADYMLSLNLDFPFRILQFLPSRWFGIPKLRFFDFDLHFSPIIDMALYHDPLTDTPFNYKNILAGGGFEMIVFPAFMRSLYIRASLAWNIVEYINNPSGSYLPSFLPVIPKLPGGDNHELFIGIGHHY